MGEGVIFYITFGDIEIVGYHVFSMHTFMAELQGVELFFNKAVVGLVSTYGPGA